MNKKNSTTSRELIDNELDAVSGGGCSSASSAEEEDYPRRLSHPCPNCGADSWLAVSRRGGHLGFTMTCHCTVCQANGKTSEYKVSEAIYCSAPKA